MQVNAVTIQEVVEAVAIRFNEKYEEYVQFAMLFKLNHSIVDKGTRAGALSNTHSEIVTDFYLRLLDKVEADPEEAEFVQGMLEDGKAFDNYVMKAISVTCRSKRSTFNYQEHIWRDTFFDNADFYSLNEEETDNNSKRVSSAIILNDENEVEERKQKAKEEAILSAIESLLEDEVVEWHMVKVFKDYYYQELTYKQIAEKYQLPLSSIFSMVRKTREVIKGILQKNDLL